MPAVCESCDGTGIVCMNCGDSSKLCECPPVMVNHSKCMECLSDSDDDRDDGDGDDGSDSPSNHSDDDEDDTRLSQFQFQHIN